MAKKTKYPNYIIMIVIFIILLVIRSHPSGHEQTAIIQYGTKDTKLQDSLMNSKGPLELYATQDPNSNCRESNTIGKLYHWCYDKNYEFDSNAINVRLAYDVSEIRDKKNPQGFYTPEWSLYYKCYGSKMYYSTEIDRLLECDWMGCEGDRIDESGKISFTRQQLLDLPTKNGQHYISIACFNRYQNPEGGNAWASVSSIYRFSICTTDNNCEVAECTNDFECGMGEKCNLEDGICMNMESIV